MKILVVEDEPALAGQIVEAIEQAGWVAELAVDGLDGLYRATEESFDAMVLDLGLPKLDGLSVLHALRNQEHSWPVIILSARSALGDRIDGLNAGADDYLCKPFQMAELIARLRAQLRRGTGQSSPVLTAGGLMLDTRTSAVYWHGDPVKLTALEFKVLSYLLHNRGKLVSRTELIEHIYRQDFDRDSNTIEVFIRRIRTKIDGDIITTVRGMGYRLD
ncbi:response regulator transcription factor [Parendozoicomonas haliclonae]|uniref:Transcriptional activator protein CzcR n=1 Tax=Parendozoicomonas haliclonae TaxID=1960125 RepID=A0A1X7AFB1_9GAMM|nr:response regulator transcription factor [Parendozoicomonas haliclonae]SMA35194.1 Transcriptional activator protein CzcR [Parendozoicomonas haliclonae]